MTILRRRRSVYTPLRDLSHGPRCYFIPWGATHTRDWVGALSSSDQIWSPNRQATAPLGYRVYFGKPGFPKKELPIINIRPFTLSKCFLWIWLRAHLLARGLIKFVASFYKLQNLLCPLSQKQTGTAPSPTSTHLPVRRGKDEKTHTGMAIIHLTSSFSHRGFNSPLDVFH